MIHGTPMALQRAYRALDRGNWLQAVDLLKNQLTRYPQCFESAIALAHIYTDQGHFIMAEELVDQAFSWLHVEDPWQVCPIADPQRKLFMLKANLRLSQGDAQGGLSLYTVLLAERPDDADLLYHMGLAYEKMGQHELALAYLTRTVEAHPDMLPAMEIKGQILMGLRMLPEALELYTEITLIDPNNVNAYASLGRIYTAMDREILALYAWERAVILAPNADEPLRMLAKAAIKRGDRHLGRDYLSRAVSANPNNVHAHFDLAELLHQVGETHAALAHWDEAERLFPGHPRLARCLESGAPLAQQVPFNFADTRPDPATDDLADEAVDEAADEDTITDSNDARGSS